jgi:hypothetical protein|tara:strand:- start:257 stop:940 length:684 start_codon:yes stop_codon:yes gene_type:complete
MIEDSLKNRKHVVDYDEEIIPTESEIEEILRTAYPLVTSKQKGYPYKFHVLGPNKNRSFKLWSLCEGNKIYTDEVALGNAGDNYKPNNGLFHIRSAPYTLIVTPRVAQPNAFHRAAFDNANSLWELANPTFVNRNNRESCAVEIGMLAKAITGATLDRGWDTSYNICFPKQLTDWADFPFIEFVPTLIQTLGKGKKYKWQTLTAEQSIADTDAPFEDIFQFVDREKQ